MVGVTRIIHELFTVAHLLVVLEKKKQAVLLRGFFINWLLFWYQKGSGIDVGCLCQL
jgi:hypothetical protein